MKALVRANYARNLLRSAAIAVALAGALGCLPPARAKAPLRHGGPATDVPRVLDLNALAPLDAAIPALAEKRVVFVGERHDRYGDHLNELAIFRRLHEHGGELALGVEFFQQPFQGVIDDYVHGRIEEDDLLRKTEYFERWRFDYRLYRPILRHARKHRIRVLALNAPQEITRKVARDGLASLGEEERRSIPRDIDRSDPEYRRRLERSFDAHPKRPGMTFEHFIEAQLVWDEGMADRAAEYLREHPRARMLILAGSGHIAWRSGIPKRLERRTGLRGAVVLNAEEDYFDPAAADFLVFPPMVELPPRGVLGAALDDSDGSTKVVGFTKESAARDAGIVEGDHVVALNGRPIRSVADVPIALLDRKPGDEVALGIVRGAGRTKAIGVKLGSDPAQESVREE